MLEWVVGKDNPDVREAPTDLGEVPESVPGEKCIVLDYGGLLPNKLYFGIENDTVVLPECLEGSEIETKLLVALAETDYKLTYRKLTSTEEAESKSSLLSYFER